MSDGPWKPIITPQPTVDPYYAANRLDFLSTPHSDGLVIFLITAAVSLFDPIALLGYVVAGVFLRPLWAAALGGAVWALAMQALVMVMTSELGERRFGHEFDGFPARLLAGALAASVVYLIARQIRRARASRLPPPPA